MNNLFGKELRRLTMVAALLAAMVLPVWALGPTIIEQTAATKFPIKVTKPGSYLVDTDIIPTSTTVDAIDVTASHVTINLNGFSIIGPGSGSGVGINACTTTPCQTNITVTNGTVTAMGSHGIFAGNDSQVEGVKALLNGGFGIVVENDSEVANSVANNNLSDGIGCNQDGLIDDNVADGNAGSGLSTNDGTTIVRNTASGNGQFGLTLGSNTGYGKNVMENNPDGCVFGSGGASMGDNVCNGVKQ